MGSYFDFFRPLQEGTVAEGESYKVNSSFGIIGDVSFPSGRICFLSDSSDIYGRVERILSVPSTPGKMYGTLFDFTSEGQDDFSAIVYATIVFDDDFFNSGSVIRYAVVPNSNGGEIVRENPDANDHPRFFNDTGRVFLADGRSLLLHRKVYSSLDSTGKSLMKTNSRGLLHGTDNSSVSDFFLMPESFENHLVSLALQSEEPPYSFSVVMDFSADDPDKVLALHIDLDAFSILRNLQQMQEASSALSIDDVNLTEDNLSVFSDSQAEDGSSRYYNFNVSSDYYPSKFFFPLENNMFYSRNLETGVVLNHSKEGKISVGSSKLIFVTDVDDFYNERIEASFVRVPSGVFDVHYTLAQLTYNDKVTAGPAYASVLFRPDVYKNPKLLDRIERHVIVPDSQGGHFIEQHGDIAPIFLDSSSYLGVMDLSVAMSYKQEYKTLNGEARREHEYSLNHKLNGRSGEGTGFIQSLYVGDNSVSDASIELGDMLRLDLRHSSAGRGAFSIIGDYIAGELVALHIDVVPELIMAVGDNSDRSVSEEDIVRYAPSDIVSKQPLKWYSSFVLFVLSVVTGYGLGYLAWSIFFSEDYSSYIAFVGAGGTLGAIISFNILKHINLLRKGFSAL